MLYNKIKLEWTAGSKNPGISLTNLFARFRMPPCSSTCSLNDDALAHDEFTEPEQCSKNGSTLFRQNKQREIDEPISTSHERIFSTSGLIVSKIKSRMCAELADELVFPKYNLLK